MKKSKKSIICIIIIFAIIVIAVIGIVFINRPNRIVIENHYGDVSIERRNRVLEAQDEMYLVTDDRVSVDKESSLVMLIDSDKHVLAKEGTVFEVVSKGTEKNGRISIELLEGNALVTIDNKLFEKSTFEVNTPNACLSVRGTVFQASYDKDTDTSFLTVEEGVVNVKTDEEDKNVEAGESAEIKDGKVIISDEKITLFVVRKYNIYTEDVADSDYLGSKAGIIYQNDSETEKWIFSCDTNDSGMNNFYEDNNQRQHCFIDEETAQDNYIIFENFYNDYIGIDDKKNDDYFFSAIDERIKLVEEGKGYSLLWTYDDFPETIILKDKDGNEEEFSVISADMYFNATGINTDSEENDNVYVKSITEKEGRYIYQTFIDYKIVINPEDKDRLFKFLKINEMEYIDN